MDRMIDFIRLVSEMRTAQKEYFKTRDKTVLQNSKMLEKAVDAQLAKFDNKLPEFKQVGLWTSEPPTQDGWYFVRTIWLETGKPDRDISVKHINARRLAEQVKRREQGVMCGNITVYRREQWAGPIEEPQEKEEA